MNITLALAMLFVLGAGTGRENNQMAPQLPGSPVPGQTPPVEEVIVPSTQSGTPATAGNEAAGEEIGVDGAPSQPGFQRDVVPQTTQSEREESPKGSGIVGSEEEGVNPDLVPDRRFETFDNDTRGTPEMEPMPKRDESEGGTIGLPPGGYGIGSPGN